MHEVRANRGLNTQLQASPDPKPGSASGSVKGSRGQTDSCRRRPETEDRSGTSEEVRVRPSEETFLVSPAGGDRSANSRTAGVWSQNQVIGKNSKATAEINTLTPPPSVRLWAGPTSQMKFDTSRFVLWLRTKGLIMKLRPSGG